MKLQSKISIVSGLALSAILAIAVTIIGAMIAATLILKGTVPEEAEPICAVLLLVLASAAAGTAARKLLDGKKIIRCMEAGAVYAGILLTATALCFDGSYHRIPVSLVAILAGALAASLPVRRGKGRGLETRRRKRIRGLKTGIGK